MVHRLEAKAEAKKEVEGAAKKEEAEGLTLAVAATQDALIVSLRKNRRGFAREERWTQTVVLRIQHRRYGHTWWTWQSCSRAHRGRSCK